MKFTAILILFCLLACEVSAKAIADTQSTASLVEIGRRIYQDGVLESGATLQGMSAAQVMLSGKQAACTACHRRSGLGSGEGTSTIRPIAGKYLFSPDKHDASPPRQSEMYKRALSLPSNSRAMYMQDSFATVLREGIDYSGQPLKSLMPRYALSEKEVAALIAYLKTLSARPDPGVDLEEIHFSTVVMPDASKQGTKAMLDVLNGFFADKNGSSRSESKRHRIGTESKYRSYRRWVLHVWTLKGPATGWKKQLEREYQKQPVFAMLSGIGNSNWQPIHDFCEHTNLPCLFPNTNLPVIDSAYYSVYLTRGITLEGEALAKHIVADAVKSDTVVQVFNEKDSLGIEAAKALRLSLANSNSDTNIVDWSFSDKPDVSSWHRVLSEKHPQMLVVWLNGDDLRKFSEQLVAGYTPQNIVLSANMLGNESVVNPLKLDKSLVNVLDRVRLVYPYELPRKSVKLLQRTKLWLHAKHIELNDEKIQANTYLTALITGDAITHMLDQFYRDYFIERVEHMVARSLVTSVYPRLSLGPGQRFASKGAYLVKFSQQAGMSVEAVTEWIVP